MTVSRLLRHQTLALALTTGFIILVGETDYKGRFSGWVFPAYSGLTILQFLLPQMFSADFGMVDRGQPIENPIGCRFRQPAGVLD
jgi:hypothetical protein